MLIKSVPVTVETAAEEDTGGTAGVFEAIVSVFGNVDSYGDRVIEGAFAKSLEEWDAKGAPVPVYWSHRMDEPEFNIGYVLEAEERPEGLWVKAQLDLESPRAAYVHRLMQQKRVTQFSFAYDIVDHEVVTEDGNEVWNLKELSLYEVGPCGVGVNQATELLTVKAAGTAARRLVDGVKAGRVLSAKNEDELRQAHEAIGRVLSALEPAEDAKSEKPQAKAGASSLSTLQIRLAVTEAADEPLMEGARS